MPGSGVWDGVPGDPRDMAKALARFMLWLGIAATISANIAYGTGYGLLGALISAWPAVAFIGAVEIAMQQVRRARTLNATPGRSGSRAARLLRRGLYRSGAAPGRRT